VTPKLVKPLDMAGQPLPTDYYIEPSDREFFLDGLLQGRAKGLPAGPQGQMDGEFGHAVPDLEATAGKTQ
jgi:pilus assembly protein CpaC